MSLCDRLDGFSRMHLAPIDPADLQAAGYDVGEDVDQVGTVAGRCAQPTDVLSGASNFVGAWEYVVEATEVIEAQACLRLTPKWTDLTVWAILDQKMAKSSKNDCFWPRTR